MQFLKRAWDQIRGVTAEREACARVAENWVTFYPESVFPVGGESVDCQSADMMRDAAHKIAADIREREE